MIALKFLIDEFLSISNILAKNLFIIAQLKLRANQLELKSFDVGPRGGALLFNENPNINIDNLMRTVAKSPKEYRFIGPQGVQITRDMPTAEDRFKIANELFEVISN